MAVPGQSMLPALCDWAAAHREVHIDIGTGDGALALNIARRQPDTAVIGLDINLDRIRVATRRHPANLRFVAADALGWPPGSLPAAGAVTIAFPYGSLLRGLVDGDERLIRRLDALLRPDSRIDVRVNASALLATGLDPNRAAGIASTLERIAGLECRTMPLDQSALRRFPSRWSKRLGYGRPANAWLITGIRDKIAIAGPRATTSIAPGGTTRGRDRLVTV